MPRKQCLVAKARFNQHKAHMHLRERLIKMKVELPSQVLPGAQQYSVAPREEFMAPRAACRMDVGL